MPWKLLFYFIFIYIFLYIHFYAWKKTDSWKDLFTIHFFTVYTSFIYILLFYNAKLVTFITRRKKKETFNSWWKIKKIPYEAFPSLRPYWKLFFHFRGWIDGKGKGLLLLIHQFILGISGGGILHQFLQVLVDYL